MGIALKVGLLGALCLLAELSNAQSYKLGRWSIDKSIQGLQIATVTNESGSVAGFLCALADQKCITYVIFEGVGCQDGGTYPMMINSAVGAYSISAVCRQLPGSTNLEDKIYVLENFSSVKEALESGGQVGFVMPLASGQFRVARFDASGATAAIKEVMTAPRGGSGPTPAGRRGARDQSL